MTEAQKLARFEGMAQRDAREQMRKLALKMAVLAMIQDSAEHGECPNATLAVEAQNAHDKLADRAARDGMVVEDYILGTAEEYAADGYRLVAAIMAL